LAYRPYFVKCGQPKKMSKCQMTNVKQEGGSVLHMTKALKG